MCKNLDLLPVVLLRKSSIPFRSLIQLELPVLSSSLDAIEENFTKKREVELDLIELIYSHIPFVNDKKSQKKLVDLKRKLFNNKNVRNEEIRKIANELQYDAIKKDLIEISDRIFAIEEQTKILKLELNLRILEYKKDFVTMLKHDNWFKSGLLLSSLDLLDKLECWNSANEKAEIKNFEMSLMKYYTRMASKTSPFSCFTTLSIGGLVDSISGQLEIHLLREKFLTKAVYNNHLFHCVFNQLLRYKPFVYQLEIKLNSTLAIDNIRYTFFINFINAESFQEVERNEVTDLLFDCFDNNKLRFGELVAYLKEELEDNTVEEIENYVTDLLDLGLLEIQYPITFTSECWDVEFVSFLNTFDDSRLKALKIKFVELSSIRLQFSNSKFEKKKELLQSLKKLIYNIYCLTQEMINEVPIADIESFYDIKNHSFPAKNEKIYFKRSSRAPFYVRKEALLYEDLNFNIDFQLNKAVFAEYIKPINELKDVLMPLSKSYFAEKAKNFFLNNHGTNDLIDLLTFFRSYKESNQFPDKESSKEQQRLFVDKSELIADLKEYLSKIIDLSDDPDVIRLMSSDLKKNTLIGAEKKAISTIPISYGVFLQPIYKTDTKGHIHFDQMVLNKNILPGNGKMFSRFLHLFNPDVTEKIKNDNSTDGLGVIFCENVDSSLFNANLHPPLMESQILIPGTSNFYPMEALINISDLQVGYTEAEDCLYLEVKSTGKRIFVFDLGFQAIVGRSTLFNFLDIFQNFKSTYLSLFLMYLNSEYYLEGKCNKLNNGTKELFFPRVVLDGKIILQRKHWEFYRSDLWEDDKGRTAFEKLKTVHDWKKRYGLPDYVFVKIPEDLTSDGDNKQLRDDYKPIFIDFNNPILINILYKIVGRVDSSLIIEEMLPDQDQLLLCDSEKYVTELLVQWSSN